MNLPIQLLLQEPESEPRTVAVGDGDTIGRDASNSIVLGDSKASKHHARIVEFEGRLAIEDLGSKNGIRLGSRTLEAKVPHPLAHGDRLTIGGSTLEVRAPSLDGSGGEAAGTGEDGMDVTLDPGATPASFESTVAPVAGSSAASSRPASEDITIQPGQLGMTIPPVKHGETIPPEPPAPSRPAPEPKPEPKPAPKPDPAPQPRAKADPIPRVDSIITPPEDINDSGFTMKWVPDHALGEADAKAFLESVDVRLVFVVHREPRSERLTKPESVIGRRSKDGVDIVLGDDSVSKRHAKVSLSQNTFRVEDLESSNGVSIAGSRLASGGDSRNVESDTCISFGAVDAFLVIPPRAGATDDSKDQAKIYREALKRLSTDVPSAKAAIGAAEKSLGSGAHPGEQLIQAGAITVVQWTDAVRKARTWVEVQPTRSGPSVATMVLVLIAIAAAAAGVYYFLTQNGS